VESAAPKWWNEKRRKRKRERERRRRRRTRLGGSSSVRSLSDPPHHSPSEWRKRNTAFP